jgi:hypothetical protein
MNYVPISYILVTNSFYSEGRPSAHLSEVMGNTNSIQYFDRT